MTDKETNTESTPRQDGTPLESWKEIAAYLKRDVRTVKRWVKNEALPVHRHLHRARSSVYAYPSSLSDFRRKPFVFNDGPFQLETVNTVI